MDNNSFLGSKIVPGKSTINKPHHKTGLVFLLCLLVLVGVSILAVLMNSKPVMIMDTSFVDTQRQSQVESISRQLSESSSVQVQAQTVVNDLKTSQSQKQPKLTHEDISKMLAE
jgi:hypothetical protein